MRLFGRREPSSPRAKLRKGARLMRAGKHREAVELYIQLQRELPDDVAVALNLGVAHFHLQQYSAAIEQFRRVAQARPEDARVWLNLAASYNALGHIDRAQDALERLGRISPDHPDRHYNLAVLHLKRRQTLKAMAELELELAANPNHRLAAGLLERLRREYLH